MIKKCRKCKSIKVHGACPNCHEAIFLEEQYLDRGIPVPIAITIEANTHRKKINRNNRSKK